MKVLVLDDEPIERDQLQMMIHENYPTWTVVQAQTGREAIDLADEWGLNGESFQLGFIDIKLPGRNGLEVAALLKERMPAMNFIVTTAFQDFSYARQSIQLKVYDYLVKPIISREMLSVLTAYVQEHPEYGMKSGIVEKAIEKIKLHYHDNLKLASVAAELHINPNYLSRLFSEEVGMSFSEFLLQRRIEMAKHMLVKQRQWSIQRIAEECGFSSQHHLSSAFKKHTELSPKDFRNMGVAR
ncbi:response regulator transcription factor [Paenibacillus turpanensis]|uniref:response regulator transcription factor n=1 Tax=Paenibacillus turpanensis TaxID=2689078 RepID=UPI0014073269|nr:helix-turn-helix domain-containing protein [Paenibacillus turpanensis]